MVQAQATAAEAARLADAGDEETSLEVAQFEEAQGIIVLDSLRQGADPAVGQPRVAWHSRRLSCAGPAR